MLQNESLHEEYGSTIFRFIPPVFRYWWLDVVNGLLPGIYSGVSMLELAPIFNDITGDISCWNEGMTKYTLPYIEIICNAHLRPSVMCLWGCSEFIHKCATVPIDVMIQQHLSRCEIKLIIHSLLSKVIWSRDDFFRDEKYDDMILMNPKGKVLPSVVFIDGFPQVMACKDHNNGSDYIMIHTCCWEHNLPVAQSYKISQVVIQS